MTDFLGEAEARYREAVERRDAIRDAWMAEESPLLAEGSTGQLVEHPLVKMLREHDLLVDRLARDARKSEMGRPATGVVRASIGKSPASRLKAVR